MTRLRFLVLALAFAAPSLSAVAAQAQVYHPRHWQRGDRYTGPRHVVGDWRRYHLSQPPRGYAWVQNGRGYLLIGPNGMVTRVWGG